METLSQSLHGPTARRDQFDATEGAIAEDQEIRCLEGVDPCSTAILVPMPTVVDVLGPPPGERLRGCR
jgi:hypothetical protein